ncbi:putative RNA recognition motif domain, mei2-like RNA recognition, RNA-binding domain superfamily [Helianthus annuus]|nr:putative RNA recognition motif domain, mei2-like RNA recognition, RNA-binding domain superfamily [Helianthus annuus]
MASNYKPPLNPNASPYLPNRSLYLYHPHPNHHSPPIYPYNTHLQPFPTTLPRFSLTPVPSGPRIPKTHRRKEMKWVPVDNKVLGLGFEETRWKNSRRGFHKLLPLEPQTTSLMIKNVPNRYTRKLLVQTLDNHCKLENRKLGGNKSAYDFVYLPIDFKRRRNAGFAFVNFTNPEAAFRFRDAFHGRHWNLFESSKVAEITRARIQGKAALINNCKGMDFSYGSEEDMPVWFAPARDGSDDQVRSKMFVVGKFSWAKMKFGN